MPDAPEIKVKLTAEDTGVSAAIKELGAQLKNLKKQQDETAASGLSLASAFKSIAAAGGAIEIAKFGRDAFESAVNIGKLSDKTGISTQALSVFHHVAEELGTSTEFVDKALVKAAKSITEFEGGSKKAAVGFGILGIKAKDFAGLKPDEKIALVTAKLGGMTKGFEKTTAAQLIFSKGGADFIPVANAIAGEGFDNITKSVAKLGLLLDKSTTDKFQAAKASMQELSDVGKGMATQFEAGLLPAISDVAEALVDSLTQGGVSFQDVGKKAGEAARGIALVFLALGQTLGTVFESIIDVSSKAWDFLKNEAEADFKALGEAAQGHVVDAFHTLAAGAAKSTDIVRDEVARQKAIYGALGDSIKSDVANLFPSEAEEKRRAAERLKHLRPEHTTDAKPVTPLQGPLDAAGKAQLALDEKLLQDELALHRAYAKQTEESDKDLYDKGAISLAEYFDRRKTAVSADAAEEIEILQKGLVLQQANVAKFAKERKGAATPKDADKSEANRLQALAKVDELQTKITTTQLAADAKLSALDAEAFKQKNTNNTQLLEFEKLIDNSAGKRRAAAQAEIEIEKQKLALVLEQSGASDEQVAKELARYTTVKTAEVEFQEQQKSGAAVLQELDDQKAAIQDRVKTGQLFQIQADQQIRDLELQRLPVLQQIADALKQQAAISGTDENIAKADDFQKKVDQTTVQSNQVGQQVATLKQGLQTSLTSGFANFFTNIVSGTASVGQAFKSLAGSVISSLSQIAAQMLATLLIQKLFGTATGGAGGGGLFASLFGAGHAEGGLIKGPGGPKADAIPARVSAGEYIVQADAVQKFGVGNLEAINRGLQIPSIERLSLPKFAEGGLVGNSGVGGDTSNINLGIELSEGLILKHLSSKAAGNIVLQHLTNNPKAASKALDRSQG
jgi:hypothetical protein